MECSTEVRRLKHLVRPSSALCTLSLSLSHTQQHHTGKRQSYGHNHTNWSLNLFLSV